MTTNLARIQPPAVFEFSPEQRKIIRDTYCGGATDQEAAVLMEIAKARRLNPLMGQIFFVKRWDSAKQCEVWRAQVSIDGLRAIAERTGLYDGQDEAEFDEDGKAIKLCKVRVYKKGIVRPFVGLAHWSEYVQIQKGGQVNSMWTRGPHFMLAKCAEAQAFRRAFPEDTSGLFIPEEMGSDAPTQQTATTPQQLTIDAQRQETTKALPQETATQATVRAMRARQAVTAPRVVDVVAGQTEEDAKAVAEFNANRVGFSAETAPRPYQAFSDAQLSGALDDAHARLEDLREGSKTHAALSARLKELETELSARLPTAS